MEKSDPPPQAGTDPPAAVPMKFFSSWEIERTASNCVARWCHLRLAMLRLANPPVFDLQGILLAVSMKNLRGRTLRSTELALSSSSSSSTRGGSGTNLPLDLTFSLQYPHYLKRKGNCLEIMLQRRNRYKSKSMPGFKTLARGHVFMDQVLQHTLVGPVPLSTKSKTGKVIIAHVDIEFIESWPVSGSRDPVASASAAGGASSIATGVSQVPLDEDLSGEEGDPDEVDDDFSEDAMVLSDPASDSDEQTIEPVRLRRGDRMKKLMLSVTKKRHWRKLFAFLKKVKIDDDEGAERDSDEAQAVEELTQDSDEDSDVPVSVDRLSNSLAHRPTLRPFFDHQPSIPSLKNFSETDEKGEETSGQQDKESPIRGLGANEQVELSGDELRLPSEHAKSWESSILSLFSSETFSAALLIIDLSCSQGKRLYYCVKGTLNLPIITTTKVGEIKEIISSILVRIQSKAHRSHLPQSLRLGIAGDENCFHDVLQAFVKTATERSVNWLELVHFLPIHLASSFLTNYVASHDSTYRSLFMDQTWTDFLESFPSSSLESNSAELSKKITKFFQAASHLYPMSVANARLQRKGIDGGDSTKVDVPFICDLQLGSAAGPASDTAPVLGRLPEVDADDSLDIFTASQSQSTATASASDGLISVSPTHAIDYFDLQIDYWPVNALSAKKDSPASKVTMKGQYRSLLVSKILDDVHPNVLSLVVAAREKNKKGIRLGKKSRVDTCSQVAQVVCSSSKATSLYKVLIDGTEWYDVKFFSVSPKALQFPLGVCSPVFPNRATLIGNETQC
ncbi:phosphofurin acidic cluster sorting protein 2-like [Oscarella lobularis]|uniref:phosphofurin acidic cluster sorting protein 2-like n=1 Tax=Oscarella lobularis TaxID=121494 RepID=UPI0033139616